MRKNRFFGPLAFMVACVAAIWLYFTPHLAVRRLQLAAESGDRAALEELVDFPAVRASLKDELREALAGRVAKESERNPFAAFGAALAGVVLDPLVDSFVTPSGIAAAVRGERPSLGGSGERAEREAKKLEISRGYEGAGSFVLHFRDRESGAERMSLVMRRDGLAAWKLSAIHLADAPR